VNYWGACFDPRLCIVMDYCSNGSLFHVLNGTDITIDWRRGIGFAMDMCAALNYLHTQKQPVYHRDVKSLNLLVSIEENFIIPIIYLIKDVCDCDVVYL
jgi:serine/threonine protein kinase